MRHKKTGSFLWLLMIALFLVSSSTLFFAGCKDKKGAEAPEEAGEEEAESYMESHNMGHFTKAVLGLDPIQAKQKRD